MKKIDSVTNIYEVEDGFYVEAQEIINDSTERMVDYWLWHRDYGIKTHLFGEEKKDDIFNENGELLLDIDSDIESYREEYMD